MFNGTHAKSNLYLARYGRSFPPYVPAITFLTIFYLAWELAFNARLLDVTGGQATEVQVTSIERWGRGISGVALTLAIWGWAILPRFFPHAGRGWPLRLLPLVLAVSGAISGYTAFRGERWIIDTLVYHSTGEERRAAAHLEAVSLALLHGTARIAGVDLSGSQIASPEGKAFLSVFRLAALSTPDLAHKTEAILREALRQTAVKEAGNPETVFNTVFIPSAVAIRDGYNAYVDGTNRRNRALADIPRQQQDAWSEYLRGLGRPPGSVPRYAWPRVVANVRAKGVFVPDGWNPADQGTFYEIINNRIRSEAQAAFETQTRAATGTPLPPGLSWAEFVAHPAIQRNWREKIGAPAGGVPLTPLMGFPAFRDGVYDAKLDAKVNAQVETLLRPAESFIDGGANEREGRSAMEALVVPPIALGFSLIGAMVHIFKASNYASQCLVPRMPARRLLIAVPLAAVALSMFLLPNAVSSSRAFAAFERQTRASWRLGWPIAEGILWTVQAQSYFYPVNETVRRVLLVGYGFGYEPPPVASGATSGTS